jgi:hypothetical protein
MIRTNQLIIVRCIDDPDRMMTFPLPFPDFENDGRCELIIEVIEMTDVWSEILEDKTNPAPCLRRINYTDGISDFGESAAGMEFHVPCIDSRRVPYAATLMFHSEILDFMPVLPEHVSQREDICF